MIIVQISDTHIALGVPDAGQRIADFEAVIADINSLDPRPDLIVHSGDIVHNGHQEEYAKSLKILDKSDIPVFAMVGNKDNRQAMKDAFSSLGYLSSETGFVDYSVEDFPVRLVMLDTLHTASNKGDFCSVRARRLDDMITGSDDARPVAVFMHHPPCEVFVGPEQIHFETKEAMSLLRNTLLQHSDRIVSIFSGHVHRSTSGKVEHIPVSITSAVATTLRKGDYPDHMKARPTYFVHRFDPIYGFVTETRIA